MSAAPDYPDLVPFDVPAGSTLGVVWPRDDWLFAARSKVIAHPHADRRVGLLPFNIEGVELGGARWNARGVGLFAQSLDGSLHDMHMPGGQQIRVVQTPDGQACYVATWSSDERPVFVQMWEMRLDCPNIGTAVRVYWRPDFTLPKKPKIVVEDPLALSRKEYALLERDIRSFIEGKPTTGPKVKRKGYDKKFESDLELAVTKLMHREEGKLQLGWVLEHLVISDDTYGRRVEQNGWTRDQIREWMDEQVRSYWASSGERSWVPDPPLKGLPRK